jgi:peptide/nickel transport system permease protein
VLRYIVRRVLLLVPILFGLSIIVFAFVRALPGGPAQALLGERATAENVAAIEEQLGLNDPLLVQYGRYMGNILSGDLGQSLQTRQPVLTELIERFPATIELGLAAILIATLIGVPLGYIAAKRYQGPIDQASLFGSLIGISFPVFFLALLLKYFLSVRWGIFPTVNRLGFSTIMDNPTGLYTLDAVLTGNTEALVDAGKHLFLPAVALATIPLAVIARITRAAVLDVLSEDYVRTARAKGMTPGVVDRRHILRNALLPVVTVLGLQTGLLLTGAILTETIFAWPGVGRWMLTAINARDFAVIQGGIIFFALVVVTVNLVVDISYAFLNPRIRYR